MKHEYTGPLAKMLLGDPSALVKAEPMKRRKPKDGPETVNDVVGVLVRADGCALAEITLPAGVLGNLTQAEVTERSLQLDFIKVKLEGLVLEARGGEYNKVEYRGTATGLTILNTAPPGGSAAASK